MVKFGDSLVRADQIVSITKDGLSLTLNLKGGSVCRANFDNPSDRDCMIEELIRCAECRPPFAIGLIPNNAHVRRSHSFHGHNDEDRCIDPSFVTDNEQTEDRRNTIVVDGIRIPRHTKLIHVKYHSQDIDKLSYVDGKSDWIDLRAAKRYELKSGEFALIDLGVSIKVPEGFEAHLAPRSSTFKNYGLLQTNSVGVIDSSYCGDNDIWKMPVYATRDTVVEINDRICQFRIVRNQPKLIFNEVEQMMDEDRGGFGSTGRS